MSPVAPHPSTVVAHEILDHYLAEWSEAVARGLRSAKPPEEGTEPPPLRVVYVDGFCNSGGRHSLVGAGQGGAGAGSALRGLRALERLAARAPGARAPLHATAVLVEEDPAEVERLERELEAVGLGGRVRRVDDPAGLGAGEIALLHAAFGEAAERVARWVASADHALCFLAPPAAGKLPLAAVRTLARARGADLLLSFPHADLQKQARYRGSTLADLPTHVRRVVDGYSALLGDVRYEWVYRWREAEREGGERAAEARVAGRYAERLAELAGWVVKRLPVHLSDEPADSLYLFLVTGDPLRALALNRAAREAGVEDRAELGTSFRAEEAAEPAEVLELFAPEEPDATLLPPGGRGVDVSRLARTLAGRFRGRAVSYREVLLELVETDLSPDEVRRAMAALKRTGEAVYRSLGDSGAEVEFPEHPVPPARRRRGGRAGAGEIPLLSELETEAEE
ncbi:MAG TPA: three-Cys-motif partner protein TcmP [Longimicrobiaceae bacterium]|nr:three-Cys-motif partner protein TcmP [Longimicrobiaceae bacterium]